MRRVNLTVEEFNEYEIIKELADHGGNKHNAAKKLGCSKRTIDRRSYLAGRILIPFSTR